MHNIETVLTTSVELAVAMENHGALAITGVQGPLLWVTCLTVQKPTVEQISLRVAATYSTKNLLVVVKDIEDAVPLAERWIEDNCTIITLSEYFTAHLNPTLKPTRDLLIANRFLRTDIGAGIRRELPEDTIYVDMGTTNFEELVRQWNSISNIITSDFNGYLGERKLLELIHEYLTMYQPETGLLPRVMVRYGWMDKRLNALSFKPFLKLIDDDRNGNRNPTDRRKINEICKFLSVSRKAIYQFPKHQTKINTTELF